MSTSLLIANRFEIKDLLGRGGMGEVYRATDTQTGEIVAVKALNSEILANDPDLLKRFVREGEALRRLDHPNIVHMVSAVEEQGRHYLVMEFVEGGSLRDLLSSQNALPAHRVIEISLDLADAIQGYAGFAAVQKQARKAIMLFAVTRKLQEEAADKSIISPADEVDFVRNLAIAREQVDDTTFNEREQKDVHLRWSRQSNWR